MEITANAIQTVNAGNSVIFDATPIGGNCSIIHREGSGLVTLRGLTRQCRARFRISSNTHSLIPVFSKSFIRYYLKASAKIGNPIYAITYYPKFFTPYPHAKLAFRARARNFNDVPFSGFLAPPS